MCYTGLVDHTPHLPSLLPLLLAQSIMASSRVGPVGALLGPRGLREDCAILKPGHGHLLGVETFNITVQSEGSAAGGRGHDRKSDTREI